MADEWLLLIGHEAQHKEVALLHNGILMEFYRENEATLVGAVILGRVERVLPDVRAAFVRIGQPLNGFLPLKETESYHRTSGSEPLMSGQEILVQVKKDPKGGKGAFLTRDIALPGQYMLLMPKNRFVGLSKRIDSEEERRQAKALGERISGNRFGIIVRHAALFASEQEVRQEAETLWDAWRQLEQNASCAKAPLLMHHEASMQEILLRDYSARHEMVVSEELQLWDKYRVKEQLTQALKRRVELPGGGSLVIDEREALQTIDVNSGSSVKAAEGMSLPLEENLKAVAEIARQIRLRNLSGIILVDFIDMDTEAERQQVLSAMQEATRDDRVKTVIHGFTRLGLLEMTRKRTSDSLREALTIPCAVCGGAGAMIQ